MKYADLEKLFHVARSETPPDIDVAPAVMDALAELGRPLYLPIYRSLLWVSMASSAAAAVIVTAALMTWDSNADSINEIINVVSWAAR